MDSNTGKTFKNSLTFFLISSILCPVAYRFLYIDSYVLYPIFALLFCAFIAGLASLIICVIYAIERVRTYNKRKKIIFTVYTLGLILATLALLLLDLKSNTFILQDVNAAEMSTVSYPLQASIIFILMIIIGIIVAGTVCKTREDKLYWYMPLIACSGGIGIGLIGVDINRNASEIFDVYFATLLLYAIVFWWTSRVTIKTIQTKKTKWVSVVKIALCAIMICFIIFLPNNYGIIEKGTCLGYNDVPRKYDEASNIEQMQVFLKQKTSEISNAEILGWDIENPETWGGVIFDGDDIVSIDLKGRGIGGNMEIIYFDKLISLDVSDNPALYELDCSYNQIETLDISGNTELRILNCGGNKLKMIDVSDNINLENFSCRGNLLTSLNVSNNTELVELYCYDNMILELDLSENNRLEILFCGGNPMSYLDVSRHESLRMLNCDDSENLTVIDVSDCTTLDFIHFWNTKVQVKSIKGIKGNMRLLMDYDIGYVGYVRMPEKIQIKIITIILAVHVITDVVAIIVSKKRILS